MNNKNPFILCPDCISDRVKLKGVLSDIFPTDKLKTNILLAAFDEGINEALLKATVIDEIFIGKFSRILTSEYGISEHNAKIAIDYWVSEYGVAVLGKKAECSSSSDAGNSQHHTHLPPNNLSATPYEVVSVKKLKENEKISKKLIKRNITEEHKHGITDINLTVKCESIYEKYVNLKITGEYLGASKKYLLIVLMIYNANNELIEACFGEDIDDDFNGRQPFSILAQVPVDEYISKIELRLTPDPVWC